MSPDCAVEGKNRKVTAVVAGVRVADRTPGTLTSGSAKSGCDGDAVVSREPSTARACSTTLSSAAGERPAPACSTTTAWLYARDEPKSRCSTAWARDAAVLLGISWTNPNPEAAPKSGRNAAAATVTRIQAAMTGSP